MPDRDTLSPSQVVKQWLDSAVRGGQLDAYEAKRKDARCSWPQPFEMLIGNELVYVQCRDISAGGIGLVCKRALSQDQTVSIRRNDGEPWIPCRVAHVTRSIGANKIGVELAFDFEQNDPAANAAHHALYRYLPLIWHVSGRPNCRSLDAHAPSSLASCDCVPARGGLVAMKVFARRNITAHSACVIAMGALLYFGAACINVTIPIPTPNPDDVNSNGVARLATFEDPDSEFTTSDVYDLDGDVIQFDSDRNVLIWTADGSEHADWMVEGNDLVAAQRYRVRFGSADGQPRAYITDIDPPTVCDLAIGEVFGSLLIYRSSTPVPQN